MVKVRLSQDDTPEPRRPRSRTKVRRARAAEKPDPKEDPVIFEDGPEEKPDKPVKVRAWRGMSERQWFVSLLVASGLLLLITFRGCILPSGVGPKLESGLKTKQQEQPQGKPTKKSASGTEYTVQPGDNLGKISQKTGADIDAITEANGISRNTILRVGQKLKIP